MSKGLRIFLSLLFIQIGAILAAMALELLLIPNSMLDGGIVGIAIITSYLSHLPLGIFTFILNIPFLLLSLRLIGKRFLFLSLYAVASLSVWVSIAGKLPVVTHDLFLATIFGGILLGLGVGLIIRNGGSLDGTEIVSIILNKRIPFSVGELVMFFNVFIFGAAAFVFGIDRALYSAAAYLIAYRMIDLVVEGIDESKSVFIVTQKWDEVAAMIMNQISGGVTILKGWGGYSKTDRNIVYVIVRRLEVSKIKELVRAVDDQAFITIHNVHEVIGRNVRGQKHS